MPLAHNIWKLKNLPHVMRHRYRGEISPADLIQELSIMMPRPITSSASQTFQLLNPTYYSYCLHLILVCTILILSNLVRDNKSNMWDESSTSRRSYKS